MRRWACSAAKMAMDASSVSGPGLCPQWCVEPNNPAEGDPLFGSVRLPCQEESIREQVGLDMGRPGQAEVVQHIPVDADNMGDDY